MEELDTGIIPTDSIFYTILRPSSDADEDYRPLPLEHIVYEAVYGVIHPLPNVVAEDSVVFNGVDTEGECVISTSSYLMHRDPTAFPDPDTFDPSRWLDNNPDVVRYRERLLAPFSRGSGVCLGQPLAMCEIYLAIGTLFHRFGDRLQAYDVGLEDLLFENYFIPFHSVTTRKFRVLVQGD
ncbi:hypothetical protein MFIFM68171_05829 [Madurella fahalii]|uniref:Cytochrome P450 n=1 Tax=Madurella fahalii TaxID=1157608 RepID=A0ABQ0GD10_9PEZI